MLESEQAKLFDLVTATLRGNATGAVLMLWWRQLKSERLEDVSAAIDTFVQGSQNSPTPHNILQILHAKRGPRPATPQEISRRYAIDLHGTTEALARRMIEDHGIEKAAELLEVQYPTHGARFVREIAATAGREPGL